MRGRRSGPGPYKLLSVLLRYPDERLLGARDEIAAAIAALPRPQERKPLVRFAEHLAGETQLSLARAYVETFDLHGRTSLYLTYYQYGDTRKRGMALLRLKRLYASAGLEQAGGELADYLPLVLEFAAVAPAGNGETLLREHRPALEVLRHGLRAAASPYADLLEALDAGLPRLSAVEREYVHRLATDGPPDERVGLQPFAPPESMPEMRV
jgi:nitrate reductase delta subunit